MKIIKKDNNFILNYTEKENTILNKLKNINFEIKEVSENVFTLVKNEVIEDSQKEPNTEKSDFKVLEIKQKIKFVLENRDISIKDKVEGRFEKLFLIEEDLPIFKEMIRNKEIILFKLSEKYKKNIYKLNDSFNNQEKKPQTYSSFKNNNHSSNNISDSNPKLTDDYFEEFFLFFENNQYVIITNQNVASNFSEKYKEKIKGNEIIGIKSFDGNYYVISFDLFSEVKSKLLSLKIESSFTLEDICLKSNFEKDLVKIVLEILKEDCLVIEKRKNIYQFV